MRRQVLSGQRQSSAGDFAAVSLAVGVRRRATRPAPCGGSCGGRRAAPRGGSTSPVPSSASETWLARPPTYCGSHERYAPTRRSSTSTRCSSRFNEAIRSRELGADPGCSLGGSRSSLVYSPPETRNCCPTCRQKKLSIRYCSISMERDTKSRSSQTCTAARRASCKGCLAVGLLQAAPRKNGCDLERIALTTKGLINSGRNHHKTIGSRIMINTVIVNNIVDLPVPVIEHRVGGPQREVPIEVHDLGDARIKFTGRQCGDPGGEVDQDRPVRRICPLWG